MGKGKVEKIIMFGKEEIVRMDEEKKREFAATSMLEDISTTKLKSQVSLRGNEDDKMVKVEKEQVKLIIKEKDWNTNVMVGTIDCPLIQDKVDECLGFAHIVVNKSDKIETKGKDGVEEDKGKSHMKECE